MLRPVAHCPSVRVSLIGPSLTYLLPNHKVDYAETSYESLMEFFDRHLLSNFTETWLKTL